MPRVSMAILTAAVVFSIAGQAPAMHKHGRGKHNHFFLNAMKVRKGLGQFAPTPMANTYWSLEAAGRRYNVNPALIIGIAAKETQVGRTSCLRYEAWGLGACGRAWNPPAFHSWHQSIFYFARHLRTRFLNHGISSVSGILSGGYCVSGCGSWAEDVMRWMAPFRMGYGVTYPG